MYFQVLNFTHFGMKNVGLGKVVIQNWEHLDIKTILASLIGGLNCEVPLYSNHLMKLSKKTKNISLIRAATIYADVISTDIRSYRQGRI